MIRGAEAFRSDEGNIEDIELVRCQRAPRCQGTHARLYAFCRDPGRSSNCPGSRPGPHRERRKPKPMMHGMKKSDEAVRPVKAVNKGAHASAEPLEERASTKGNPERQSTRRTQCRESVPQAAARIREAAEIGEWLGQVCNGWLNYFAVPGSGRYVRGFVRRLQRLWMWALRRRSQRYRFSWKRLERMTELLWPRVSIRHPWPDQRFTVNHPR